MSESDEIRLAKALGWWHDPLSGGATPSVFWNPDRTNWTLDWLDPNAFACLLTELAARGCRPLLQEADGFWNCITEPPGGGPEYSETADTPQEAVFRAALAALCEEESDGDV